jgi:trans-aconitate methyltransferase
MKYTGVFLSLFSLSLLSMESKWDGNQYLAASKPQFDIAMDYLNQLTIKPDEFILDVGCGSGKNTAEIGRRVPHGQVIGVDSSESMIATAQKEFSSKNTSFQVMKAQELIFDTCFDRIVSFGTFHWIKDQKAAFEKCAQALRPGGTLHVITSGGIETKTPSTLAFYTTIQLDKWKEKLKDADIENYYFPLGIDKAKELLVLANLELKEMTPRLEKRTLPDIESFKKFITVIVKGAYRFLNSLSQDEQNELFEDFTKNYFELVPMNQDGSVDYKINALTIVAQKK